MIDLKDLQFLTALARHRHFARAAEECGVTQPAFSMRIRRIEERLGAAIVNRGNRFLGFTAEGDALVRNARKIMDDVKTLEQEFRSARGEVSGPLALGVVPTAMTWAAQLADDLRTRHPNIFVRIHAASSLAIQQGLENGTYDAGITYTEGILRDLMRVEPLYAETYQLVAPVCLAPRLTGRATWEEAARLPLTLLTGEMQNRRILNNVFKEQGLVPHVVSETSGISAAVAMVARGGVATVVPGTYVESLGTLAGMVSLPLTEPDVSKDMGLVSLIRDPGLPTVEALRRMLAQGSEWT